MRKRCLTAVLIFLLPLTSCRGDLLPRARDITTVELMQVLAIDKGEGDKLRVTAASGVHSGGTGAEPKPPIVLTREAETVFAACMDIQSAPNGYASFSHVEQLIFSAEATRQSTAGLLDFLERDPEMRLNTHAYVTQQETGETLLQTLSKEDRTAAEQLEAIERELSVESLAWPVTVRELLMDLEDNGCALLPVLTLDKEEETPTLRCGAMGWFREDDFQQSLTEEQSRAAALLEGEMDTAALEVNLPGGALAGLRLTDCSCRWEPIWTRERLTGFHPTLEVKADLAELQGQWRTDTEQDQLRQAVETLLRKQVRELLKLSQREGDFLHLQRRARVQCPGRYESIDQNWERWFPALDLEPEVRCTVERSYDLTEGRAP